MQNIFRGDGLLSYAALREGDVLRDTTVEMMRNHQHIERFIKCIHRVRSCGIGRSRYHISFAAHLDDIWRVAASSAFCVKRMDCSALECGDCVLHKAPLIQRIGMRSE